MVLSTLIALHLYDLLKDEKGTVQTGLKGNNRNAHLSILSSILEQAFFAGCFLCHEKYRVKKKSHKQIL